MSCYTMIDILESCAQCTPDKVAVISSSADECLTYQNLISLASQVSQNLYDLGCKPGDRILLTVSNTPLFFAALYGCFYGRFVAVPIDSELALNELKNIVHHGQPNVVVGSTVSLKRLKSLLYGFKTVSISQLCSLNEVSFGFSSLSKSNDPALLLYTSGTTGSPKGVLYSQNALASKVLAIRDHFGFNDQFVSLCLLPTHFGHGLICNCLSTLSYGGTLVISRPFDLDLLKEFSSIISRHKVNVFSSVPTIIRILMEYLPYGNSEYLCSLKFVTCASAPLWPSEIQQFEDIFNVPLLNCYGLTETAGWIACSLNKGKRPLASVGQALNCDIRVVDNNGQVLQCEEIGELQIKGSSVMEGYYQVDDINNIVVNDGWFSTGDIGYIDNNGAVFLHSRSKELIIRGGKNIYPTEIDQVLMEHPEIKEAYSVGINDALLGEKVAACVVRNNNSQLNEVSLIAYTREKLADYKCPQHIKFMDRIPKNSRGKVSRANLRPQFEVSVEV